MIGGFVTGDSFFGEPGGGAIITVAVAGKKILGRGKVTIAVINPPTAVTNAAIAIIVLAKELPSSVPFIIFSPNFSLIHIMEVLSHD